MAIGDTVQAGLMRVDTTPLLQAQIRSSEQMGNAIAGLGRDIGSGIEKFMQNKKEGEAADMQIGALLQNMSPERQKEIQSGEGELGKSLSKFLSGELGNSKKKALLGSLMTINTADQLNREEAMDAERFKQQQEINNLNRLIAQGKIDDRLSDRQATDRFITKLYSQAPTGKLNEAGQDDLERGLAFLAPGPQAREKYKNRLLQDPQFQQTEPVMGMTGNRFTQQFAGEIPAVQERALAFMQANAPKPLSPSDQLAREKFDYQKAKDAEEAKPKPPQAPIYMEAAIEAIDDSLKFVEEDSIINPTVGFGSETMANIGGTDAANLQAALSTVTSAIGFKRLQDMREASPTGGALGAVSERELSQLNAALGSISQKQGKPQLKKNLERIKKHYQNSVKAINAQRMAYQQGKSFKSEQEALDFINQQSQEPGIDTKQGTYRIPGLSVEAQ